MKRLLPLTVFALIILCPIGAKAQDLNLPNIFPPFSNTAFLGHYAGVLIISIPLFNVKFGEIELPITLREDSIDEKNIVFTDKSTSYIDIANITGL
ncbi:hypothetical protein Q4Q34_15415 [Flavivirga abyssicola]|uniref:hypothetical protein n=1 Tax=Flavivirga abyssicola TaxID=3063533 RepID=UPI0026DEACC1|nr:hypothetical protein [Flavivirga sp. MEBiC07777]WVK12605.1 hypothetical protein Q4Q34_15415 [Flavivirga sp. MEBiC07777]